MLDGSPPDIAWIDERWCIGSRPYAAQRPRIAALGVNTVVALHHPDWEERDAWAALGVELVSLPTRDWVEIPAPRITQAVGAVLEALDRHRMVLLHCLAGVNRAPTVAAAVLCRREGLVPEEAIARVRHARPAAAPTPEQFASLRAWFALEQRRRLR